MATTRKKTWKQHIKNLLHQLHLILGLVSGIVVIVVGITGALFVFEEEGRELLQHKYYHVADEGGERLPMAQLVDSFKAHYPAQKIASIRFKEQRDAAFVFFTKSKLVSVNPYTGAVTGVRNPDRDFFMVVQKIHTELYLGEVGKQIIRWNVLIFFVMCISGLVLWWPKQKRFLKQALRINFKTKNWKRLNWDLHSVLGFYALFVLLIIASTGLFWVFDTAKSVAGFITQSPVTGREEKIKSKVIRDKKYSLDEAYRYASAGYPGATETFITPAADSTAPIRLLMRYPYTIVRKQNALF
ncbi:MAG TPA: PepSY-associated TM helix domain-containing protein, partial [Chitinophagaceae bacterium]|nr:PepSY-associated TM helix domain-containing protein [Chitinophagaceae bacterium]